MMHGAFTLVAGECVMEKPFSSNSTGGSGGGGGGTTTTTQQQPILKFDQETNAVRIVPRGTRLLVCVAQWHAISVTDTKTCLGTTVSEGGQSETVVVEEATVELAFAAFREVAANGTVLQVGRAIQGSWQVALENTVGASQAFVFSAPITFDDDQAESSGDIRVELEMFLFDEPTNVSVGEVATFEVVPSLTKFTVAMWLWPWLSNTSRYTQHTPLSTCLNRVSAISLVALCDCDLRVELSLEVSPPFTQAIVDPPPAASEPSTVSPRQAKTTTTFTLQGQNSSSNSTSPRTFETQVRFVSVVELDGVVRLPADLGADGRAPVEFSADLASSSLVLSFGYFAGDMSYDPGMPSTHALGFLPAVSR
jgi:hypothetical protein